MTLVVTKDGMIGMACATVRSDDIVCLLEGTTPVAQNGEAKKPPIILRRVTMADGQTFYKVVGGIFLAERKSRSEIYILRGKGTKSLILSKRLLDF